MAKRMLIDATSPDETRVAVVNGTRLEEFDYETEFRKQLKGNIYLAQVTRVEPSLQAAFVEYGGNRHAFLPFPEIHQDYFRIPVSDREALNYQEQDEPEQDRPVRQARAYTGRPAYHEPEDQPISKSSDESSDPEESEVSAANETEPDLISEVFERVEQESAGQDHDSQDEVEEHREPSAEERLENLAYDQSGSDPFGQDEQNGEAEPQQTAHGDAADQAASEAIGDEPKTVIETVGGDDVEDMRHRRRAMMPRYKIQEVIKRRQIMLIQVSKEERGNKGAAITTFLSLPGRYCVLMPNTPRGGGVSRKIANPQDRKRLKDLMSDLELPEGMSVILRTAGVERTRQEIARDLEYLLRLWEGIRDLTLKSTAPALVYEEGNLIKRAVRDIYSKEIDEIVVAGPEGFRQAKDFMRMMMPTHARRVVPYREQVPLFFRFGVETQIDAIHNPVAQLKSGGYCVINQTEALVSIDVNSGRSTRERNIEETAYKTNLEAADEIARQLRLRDLGGLVVIDFIDMEDSRHDGAVERRLKEAMKNDRARIQIGRMSAFGLLELSRQRLHPSLLETNFHTCPACQGAGLVRSTESAAFMAIRAIEEEGIKAKAAEVVFHASTPVALYLLNHRRNLLTGFEERYGMRTYIATDDTLGHAEFRIERVRPQPPGFTPPVFMQPAIEPEYDLDADEALSEDEGDSAQGEQDSDFPGETAQERGRRRRRRRGRRKPQFAGDQEGEALQGSNDDQPDVAGPFAPEAFENDPFGAEPPAIAAERADSSSLRGEDDRPGRRRRGRRGGRNRGPGLEGSGLDSPELEIQQDSPEHGELADVALPPEGTGDPVAIPDGEQQQAGIEFLPDTLDLPVPENTAHDAALPEPTTVEPGPQEATPTAAVSETQPERQAREYETVNQKPDAPREGWWKRLIQ